MDEKKDLRSRQKPTLPEQQEAANAVDETPRWTKEDAEKHPGA